MEPQPNTDSTPASSSLPTAFIPPGGSQQESRPHSLLVTFETGFANLQYTTTDELECNLVIHESETGAQLKRHADLWFEDGSVVCRAENTLFRVHMSQLARHSVFFRDMFSMPQPRPRSCVPGLTLTNMTDVQHDVQRVPIVNWHDTAEDVGNLLIALYDGPNFGNNDQDDFRIVSGILRLSTKYIIESLRVKALAHLSIAWPSDLKAWDAREDLARSYEIDTTPNGGHLYPHPIAVINLAREVDAPSLLPAAFYDLSRYLYTQIFELTEDDLSYRPLPPAPSSLSMMDMQRLCLGKETAQHTITSLISAMGSGQYVRPAQHVTHTHAGNTAIRNSHIRKTSGGGVCVSAAACRKDFSELVDLATQHYLFDRERGCCDPLYVAEELGQLKSAELSECKACAKSLESWAAREREKMWKSIPLWFRLDLPTDGSPKPLLV